MSIDWIARFEGWMHSARKHAWKAAAAALVLVVMVMVV